MATNRQQAASQQGSSVMFDYLEGFLIFVGIWLIASAYILEFKLYHSLRISNNLLGAAIIGMAITRLTVPPRYKWVSIPNVIFGIWVLVSPFAFGFGASTVSMINNVVIGAVVVLIALLGFVRKA